MSDEVVSQLPKCLKGAEVKIFTTDGEIFEGKVYQTYDGKKPKLMVCELRVDGVLQPSCRKNGIGYEEVFIDEMASLEVTNITPAMEAAGYDPEECTLKLPTRPQKPMIAEGRSMLNRNSGRGGGTGHLGNLHKLRMPEILAQVQLEDPPEEQVLPWNRDQKFKPLVIPRPEQDPEHMEGDKFQGRLNFEFKDIRSRIPWTDANTPPDLDLPIKYYLVSKIDAFKECISQITDGLSKSGGPSKTKVEVGVSLQGQFLCRLGKLSLVCLATSSAVYLFDVVALGDVVCFQSDEANLKTIFENQSILKVANDFRGANDLLFHQAGVRVRNVVDLTAQHSLFFALTTGAGHLPKYTPSTPHLARAYLGVKGSHLYLPKYRLSHLNEDTAIWMERPLTKVLEVNAVRDTMYLLEIHRCQAQAIQSFAIRASDVMINDYKNGDDNDVLVKIHESHVMPDETSKVFFRHALN